jgi:mevalonate kinase
MTSAFGKVILVGEHAVVHGHAALAAAIDRQVKVWFEGRPSGPISLAVPHWNLSVSVGEAHPLADALGILAREVGAEHLSVSLHALAELPPAAGLGSSAAVMVAVARALAAAAGRRLSPDRLEEIATAGERCFHGNPSGIDVALAARGGVGLYRRSAGLQPVTPAAPLELAVGLSGEPRRTADMVGRVASALAARPDETGGLLEELGRAAEAGAVALEAGELTALAGGMARAQEILASLGLSTRGIDMMIEAALREGAMAAKLTGAGGGGAVIALAEPGRTDEIISSWRAIGRNAFRVRAGAPANPQGEP